MSVSFSSAVQQECYERLGTWLKEEYGETVYVRTSSPGYEIPTNGMTVMVHARTWKDDDARIVGVAYLVSGAPLTVELSLYLLRKNIRFLYGSYFVDSDDDIGFTYNIVGSTADKREVVAMVDALRWACAEAAQEIVSEFGGRLYSR